MSSLLQALVAINEETFNLDDLVEARIHIEIPVGKGIPTSRALIKCVIFPVGLFPTHSGFGGDESRTAKRDVAASAQEKERLRAGPLY